MKQALYLALVLSSALAQDTIAQNVSVTRIDSAKLHWAPPFLVLDSVQRSDTSSSGDIFFGGTVAPWIDFQPAHWDTATVEYYRREEHQMLQFYTAEFAEVLHNDTLRAADTGAYLDQLSNDWRELVAARHMVLWLDYFSKNPSIDPKIVVPGIEEAIQGKRSHVPVPELNSKSVSTP